MLCLAIESTFSAWDMENPPGMALLTQDLTWSMTWSRYALASMRCWVVPQLRHVIYGVSASTSLASNGAPQYLHLSITMSSKLSPYRSDGGPKCDDLRLQPCFHRPHLAHGLVVVGLGYVVRPGGYAFVACPAGIYGSVIFALGP